MRYFAAGGGGSYGSTTVGGGGAALRHCTDQQMPIANAATMSAEMIFLPQSCAGAAQSFSGLGIHEIADALGEIEVHLGEAALAVRGEDDAHLRVVDVNIRVVIRATCDGMTAPRRSPFPAKCILMKAQRRARFATA